MRHVAGDSGQPVVAFGLVCAPPVKEYDGKVFDPCKLRDDPPDRLSVEAHGAATMGGVRLWRGDEGKVLDVLGSSCIVVARKFVVAEVAIKAD